ncbi:hypothetical protein [Raoultibacter massiliensis]|uniref:Uncharacterized protein n=1 Tax=Raoultibacter massiliensis TaxID=1852371 RepID=A0ABV1JDE0_9ACTN|nr:hypothetical protein [Raoultibacter massiliensis]
MKDFNGFLRVLASDESKAEVERIILDNAMEEEREGNDIHTYLYTVIDAVTDYKLRKYHEWVSQD